MDRKMRLVQIVIRLMAIVGVLLFIGAIGNDDYMTEIGVYYPVSSTVIKMCVGIIFTIPEYLIELI